MFSKVNLVLIYFTSLILVICSATTYNKGLNFLGSAKNLVANQKTGNQSVRESQYHLFYGPPSTWTEAKQLCLDELGTDATLLYIETLAELSDIQELLKYTGMPLLYWIGGEWNSTASMFQWSNGVPISSEWDSIWDDGHPNSQTRDTKLLIFQYNANPAVDLRFRSAHVSELQLFICEHHPERV